MRRFGSLGMSSSGALGRVGVQGDGSLSDVIASAVFDLDATQAASYTSGTTWSNLVTAPADGSAQTAYDFTNTGMTFTGSAGTSSAYWLQNAATNNFAPASNTTFLNSLHNSTTGTWWAAFTVRPDTLSTTNYFGTGNTGAAENALNIRNVTGKLAVRQRDAVNGLATATNVTATITAAADTLIIVSHSIASNQTRIWINSSTAETISHTYTSSANNASATAQIGTRGASIGGLTANSRWYSFAMGNEYLDNTKAAAIIAALQTRHGRIYAP